MWIFWQKHNIRSIVIIECKIRLQIFNSHKPKLPGCDTDYIKNYVGTSTIQLLIQAYQQQKLILDNSPKCNSPACCLPLNQNCNNIGWRKLENHNMLKKRVKSQVFWNFNAKDNSPTFQRSCTLMETYSTSFLKNSLLSNNKQNLTSKNRKCILIISFS